MNEDIKSNWTREQSIDLIKRTNKLIEQAIGTGHITDKMIQNAKNDVKKLGKII